MVTDGKAEWAAIDALPEGPIKQVMAGAMSGGEPEDTIGEAN